MKVELVDPRLLKPNPWNSNRVSPENMEKLKRSITDLGFATAVVVRAVRGGLEILGGQHRTEAAVELGLSEIPVVNLGKIDDVKAKKIGLVDNHRYGNDDAAMLAKIIEGIGEDAVDLSYILPVGRADIESIIGLGDIDLDSIGLAPSDDDRDPEPTTSTRPAKTHEIVKFRLTLGDAEKLRALIERTIRKEKFDDKDEMTAAGDALSFLLLGGAE